MATTKSAVLLRNTLGKTSSKARKEDGTRLRDIILGLLHNPRKRSAGSAPPEQQITARQTRLPCDNIYRQLASGNEWEPSWNTHFAKSMRRAFDPEVDTLVPAPFDKVISRLLRPFASDGRSSKPSLVHGDLWFANSRIDVGRGVSLIFNTCSFYALNERKC